MVKTTSIAARVQFQSVRLCAVCLMSEKWLLTVLFVILWAHPLRPLEYPTLKPTAAGVGSLSPCAPRGHRFTILPGLVLVKANPPRPASTTAPGSLHYGPAPLSLRPCLVPPPR